VSNECLFARAIAAILSQRGKVRSDWLAHLLRMDEEKMKVALAECEDIAFDGRCYRLS
jgi:hypothetical protein